ncbi:hypothetical protein HELRODRAFT_184233 [Helobdella robusta]|uniref:Uncharacterized protein n=1 Tax=Helobdella robusta TaxID=6412 RepID=T1FKT4_HELRO|nr:hypothetical protein HELRODRAFT_184233 [Helobdella robusta]ESO04505.1 hypothetical protein HELRODRAFT_184233 [Helobdella robusta]
MEKIASKIKYDLHKNYNENINSKSDRLLLHENTRPKKSKSVTWVDDGNVIKLITNDNKCCSLENLPAAQKLDKDWTRTINLCDARSSSRPRLIEQISMQLGLHISHERDKTQSLKSENPHEWSFKNQSWKLPEELNDFQKYVAWLNENRKKKLFIYKSDGLHDMSKYQPFLILISDIIFKINMNRFQTDTKL